MTITAPTAPTAAPTIPDRSDRTNFPTQMFAFNTWRSTNSTETYNLATNAYNNATDAAASAATATTKASDAAASATAAQSFSGASVWVSGTTYAIGDVRWSPINYLPYRRTTNGAGTTDPSADTTNWTRATAGGYNYKVAIAASDIDLKLGDVYTKTITTTTTFTVSNVPASPYVASILLELTNGGSQTINWWTGVKWAAGLAPTLTTSGRDVLGFYTHDGGTTWTGLLLAKDAK